jgi:hypothetical protein
MTKTAESDAKPGISAGCRIAMAAIAIAVLKRHQARMPDRREWLLHLVRRCEAMATNIAEQATDGPHSEGATFIEVYTKTLPALVTVTLDAHERALREQGRPQ